MEDASVVHKLTGICPSVAIHIPWDRVDDYGKLKAHAEQLGLAIGAVNPNLFQDDDYKFGSVTNVKAAIRQKRLSNCSNASILQNKQAPRKSASGLPTEPTIPVRATSENGKTGCMSVWLKFTKLLTMICGS